MKNTYNVEIGKAIRSKRLANGWTQAELADKASLSSNFIARVERGELCPSLATADQICQALLCSLDSIVCQAPDLYQ